jgi:hypothetical protein
MQTFPKDKYVIEKALMVSGLVFSNIPFLPIFDVTYGLTSRESHSVMRSLCGVQLLWFVAKLKENRTYMADKGVIPIVVKAMGVYVGMDMIMLQRYGYYALECLGDHKTVTKDTSDKYAPIFSTCLYLGQHHANLLSGLGD